MCTSEHLRCSLIAGTFSQNLHLLRLSIWQMFETPNVVYMGVYPLGNLLIRLTNRLSRNVFDLGLFAGTEGSILSSRAPLVAFYQSIVLLPSI